MSRGVQQSGVEWVCGLVNVPAYVCDDAAPYRPDALFWIDENGVMLRSHIDKPGRLLGQVVASLRDLIAEHGPTPTRVRTASRDLAAQLTAALPALEIMFAPTPEIDALEQLIRAQFERDAARSEPYLAAGRSPEAMAAFFAAAAELFRAAPWRCIAGEQHPLSVTIEALRLRDAVLAVSGQRGRDLGWALFANRADFERYLDATDALAHGQRPALPSHFALHFERGAALPPGARKEVARHGWQVAGADAFPWLTVMDEDLIARPPTAAEVTIAEGISRALPRLLGEDLDACPRIVRVSTHGGVISVSLRTLRQFSSGAELACP